MLLGALVDFGLGTRLGLGLCIEAELESAGVELDTAEDEEREEGLEGFRELLVGVGPITGDELGFDSAGGDEDRAEGPEREAEVCRELVLPLLEGIWEVTGRDGVGDFAADSDCEAVVVVGNSKKLDGRYVV